MGSCSSVDDSEANETSVESPRTQLVAGILIIICKSYQGILFPHSAEIVPEIVDPFCNWIDCKIRNWSTEEKLIDKCKVVKVPNP